MNKVRAGVIGVGHLGKLHTKMMTQDPNCEFVGVFDANPEIKKSVAAEFSTIAYDTLDTLLEQVDAVSIAATTSAHHEIAKLCLQRGKHVFIEKPITATIEEGEEIVKIAGEQKLILQVGHIERFNPALLSLEKYILKPKFIQTDRLAPFNPRGADVAVVLDLMIHDIDIILSLVKSEVKEIRASRVAVVSDTVDIANVRLEFENGAVAIVTASRISQKKMRKMRIFQQDTYISLDFTTGNAELFRLIAPDETVPQGAMSFGDIGMGEKKKKLVYEQPESFEINALKHELSLFIQSVKSGTRPVVSGEDGLRALKVADSIIRIIEESYKRAVHS